jgi:hypothetical protein
MKSGSNIDRVGWSHDHCALSIHRSNPDVHTVHACQPVFLKHVLDRPMPRAVAGHQHHRGGEIDDDRQQVRHQKNRDPVLTVDAAEELDDRRFPGDVHADGGFIAHSTTSRAVSGTMASMRSRCGR